MRDPTTNQPVLADEIVRWLPRVALFRGLTMAEIRLVASIAEEVQLAPGDYLTSPGQMASSVHLLYEGNIAIMTPTGVQTRIVRPPEDYGLVSLVEPRRLAQGTLALTSCRVVAIPADALQVLMESDPSIGLTLWRNIARLQTFHFMQLVDRWVGQEPRDTFNPYRR